MSNGGEIHEHFGLRRTFRQTGKQRSHRNARAFDDERTAAQFRAPLEVVCIVELHDGRISDDLVSGNAGFAVAIFLPTATSVAD